MNIELFLCRVVTVVLFGLFVRETFYGTLAGTLWCFGCTALSAWSAAYLKDITFDGPVVLDIWCELCQGSGTYWEEYQRGVVGVGGNKDCPDCDGHGYTKTAAYRVAK